jgi:SAM-dependent methyltransferase
MPETRHFVCPVCDSPMNATHIPWRFDCPDCGYLMADLKSTIEGESSPVLDEASRECALAGLRRRNFEYILDRLDAFASPGRKRLLDVGCAHGWFLDVAAGRGYEVHGIEPDRRIGALAAAKGHDVTPGFFPGDLPTTERFDVIVFNDVFEHLPEPRMVLGHVRRLLTENGILILNLPSSKGIVFRIADALSRFGMHGPHHRMWQYGFPSPHLSYFHPESLKRLALRYGFVEVDRATLTPFDVAGLWDRLRFDRAVSWPFAALAWVALTAASPVIPLLPADISLQIFRTMPQDA